MILKSEMDTGGDDCNWKNTFLSESGRNGTRSVSTTVRIVLYSVPPDGMTDGNCLRKSDKHSAKAKPVTTVFFLKELFVQKEKQIST